MYNLEFLVSVLPFPNFYYSHIKLLLTLFCNGRKTTDGHTNQSSWLATLFIFFIVFSFYIFVQFFVLYGISLTVEKFQFCKKIA